MRRTLLCLGYGYSAAATARLMNTRKWRLLGATRSNEKAARMREEGVEPLAPNEITQALHEADHLLISAAPDAQGDPILRAHGDAIAKHAAQHAWVGYLSTTGVYGDHKGGWVNETTPCVPATKRGEWRVAAENAWLEAHQRCGLPVHVFRLAGIYGPGRGPFAKVRGGTARRIVKPNQVFSRIHVADIAQTLLASIARPNPGAIYNVCDDDPAPPQDVVKHAAELLGAAPPPEEPFAEAVKTMTLMAQSFYAESKRVSNDRIKQELGVSLFFPTYRAGLSALLKEETEP